MSSSRINTSGESVVSSSTLVGSRSNLLGEGGVAAANKGQQRRPLSDDASSSKIKSKWWKRAPKKSESYADKQSRDRHSSSSSIAAAVGFGRRFYSRLPENVSRNSVGSEHAMESDRSNQSQQISPSTEPRPLPPHYEEEKVEEGVEENSLVSPPPVSVGRPVRRRLCADAHISFKAGTRHLVRCELDEAEVCFQSALRSRLPLLGADHPEVAACHEMLGHIAVLRDTCFDDEEDDDHKQRHRQDEESNSKIFGVGPCDKVAEDHYRATMRKVMQPRSEEAIFNEMQERRLEHYARNPVYAKAMAEIDHQVGCDSGFSEGKEEERSGDENAAEREKSMAPPDRTEFAFASF